MNKGNLTVLSNSSMRGPVGSGALKASAAMSLGLSSPRANSPKSPKTSLAFTIEKDRGIPTKDEMRTADARSNRMDSLLRMPAHKQGTTKFDAVADQRTIAPLTQEDIGQFANLGLMSTLRNNAGGVTARNRSIVQVENPPSFYDDDLKKKQEKYAKAIKERIAYKRSYLSSERRSIHTTNGNVAEADADKKLADSRYTGGQITATRSEFKRVVQRRKSRQSVCAPTNVDIDFVGNSNNFSHLIKGGKLTKDELTFGMNLRSYKNSTQFNAQEPWRLPGPKEFSPMSQYNETRTFLTSKNGEFKGKFKDKLAERNAGEIMHMVRRNDVYSNVGWMCNLRGDREALARKSAKSANPTKFLRKNKDTV